VSARRIACALVALATVAAGAGPARAQDGEQEARARFEEGLRHYNVGEYVPAIEHFKRAYVLSPQPLLLFDIAQAYRLSGQCSEAVRYYRRYVEAEPQGRDRAAADRWLGELSPCPERAATPTEAARTAPSSRPAPPRVARHAATAEPAGRSIAPLVVAIAGGVVAVAGAILQWRARATFEELRAECGFDCAEDRWSTWEALTWTSYAAMAAGALAGVGGVLWWLALPSGEAGAGAAPSALRFGGAWLARF